MTTEQQEKAAEYGKAVVREEVQRIEKLDVKEVTKEVAREIGDKLLKEIKP